MQGNQEKIFVPASAKSKGTFERKKKKTQQEKTKVRLVLRTGFLPPSHGN